MQCIKIRKLKERIDHSVDDYMTAVYSKSESQRNLIEFRVGSILLILGNAFSLVLFYALSREKFIVLSAFGTAILLFIVVSATRNGAVTQVHYAAAFTVLFIYGLFIFILGDNTRGVIIFGLMYPVLSVYTLKELWGNLLIASVFVSSLLCDFYLNPRKMNRETCSLYICMYLAE